MRRQFIVRCSTLVLGLGLFCSLAQAQSNWPARPIRMFVAGTPGGPTDTVARVIGQAVDQRLGQGFVVEAKLGAGGFIAAEAAAKAPPDGYTFTINHIAVQGIGPALYPKLNFDPKSDYTSVARLVTLPNAIYVRAESPLKSLRDLADQAAAAPGKFAYGSSGQGTSNHLTGVVLGDRIGTKFTHVPYKGSSPVLVAVLGGEIQFGVDSISTIAPQVKAGKVRVLAVTSGTRSPHFPDLPTVAESGFPGFDITTWYGIVGPKGVPAAIVDKLSAEVARALESPAVTTQLQTLGMSPAYLAPKAYDNFMQAEMARWEPVVKSSGTKIE